MYVLGVVGPDVATDRVAERLVNRLREDGRVATVARDESDRATDSESSGGLADASYRLSKDGWSATGKERSLPKLLSDLAPDYDYAILTGFPKADVPQIVLRGAEAEVRETLLEVDDADTLDPAEAVSKLHGTEPYETLDSLVTQAKASEDAPYSGAIATFTGRVRSKEDSEDEPTKYLEFEKYEGVAAERMDAISDELTEREGVFEVLMHHRTGVIEYGEDIVFVVVLAGHREEAFRTVEDGINRLKDEVPIFKKEVTSDEQFWVHEQS
ncbi:molybdopterin synthase [Halorussus halophilus]|uniref:molybdopterin synthase n=1 Tax=Halorussus halophilus TaxID=2650975 RepID=UPI001301554D|nr:molybdopterin synthase [Halorussus halophilus]